MDDALLMGVLDCVADLNEQVETLVDTQPLAIAMLGDRDSRNVLHDEVRPAIIAHPRVEDPGHARMVHHGQCLTLGLETGDDLLRIHAQLDDFEGDSALDGLGLLGEVDDAHPALADLLKDPVRTDLPGQRGRRRLTAVRRTRIRINRSGVVVVRAGLFRFSLCHKEPLSLIRHII